MSPSPGISAGIFEGFLSRAQKNCSKKYLQEEAQLLIDVFVENGYNNNILTRTAKEFQNNINKPERQ